MFNLDWHVMVRGEVYDVVSVTPGDDPCYGRYSWDHLAGPFDSEAEGWAWVEQHEASTAADAA